MAARAAQLRDNWLAFRQRSAARLAGSMLLVLRVLSEKSALALGAALGRSWVRLSGPRTADARVNLRIAFPAWSEARRELVLLRSMENMGRNLAEFARIGTWSDAELRRRVRVEGMEHAEAASAASPNGAVLVLTAHFGSWELLAAAAAAHGMPISAVQRPRDNPLLEDLVSRVRAQGGAEFMARGNAARPALRALRSGRYLAILYDRNARPGEGVFVPFFGRLASAVDGPPRLALRTGVAVLPAFIHRESDGIHHVCRFLPPLFASPEACAGGDAVAECAKRWTRIIEEQVRSAPEQWDWSHRRWKTQPQGEPAPYR